MQYLPTTVHSFYDYIFSAQGMDVKDGNIRLISEVISNALSINMSVLMGANVAKDVAQEDFCESTIGELS